MSNAHTGIGETGSFHLLDSTISSNFSVVVIAYGLLVALSVQLLASPTTVQHIYVLSLGYINYVVLEK